MGYSDLPALVILLPLFGAGVVYWIGFKSKKFRDYLAVLLGLLTLVLVATLYPVMRSGEMMARYSFLPFARVEFSANSLSFLLALLTAFVWAGAILYSLCYMQEKENGNRFYAFLLISLSANLGVFLAGNFFTLFIFFDLLGLSAYPLIVHNETREAFKAGAKYLTLVVVGDLFLLLGILLFYSLTDTVAFTTGVKEIADSAKFTILALMGIGFGIKAGVIPLHIWLPEAHPVAPSPASALLSGIMIKAGAYGIIRALFSLFGPKQATTAVGFAVIWVGIITMLFAVLMALLQENAKRMLAYHSISQMGYIVLGIGCAAYLGIEGGLALGGGLYHLVNHALFKACLFLTVGAVYYRTHELNMYKLGGLARKMPLIAFCTLIASLGISGIPPFNGYASKTLIHQALSHLGHGWWIVLAEVAFIVTCGGTIASFTKLFALTFLGEAPQKCKMVKDAPVSMLMGIMALTSMIFALGIFPNYFWTICILPLLRYMGYTAASLHGAGSVSIWTRHDIQSLIFSLVVGILMFVAGTKYGLFHMHFPRWFSVNYWFERSTVGVYFLLQTESQISAYAEGETKALGQFILGTKAGVYRITEDWDGALGQFILNAKRKVRGGSLRKKEFVLDRIRYMENRLWSSFAARIYHGLSAHELGKEVKFYVQDINFSVFLILVLLVVCFVLLKVVG